MTDTTPTVPEWAKDRADEYAATALGYDWRTAFARYIAEHEEQPVDPLLIEAREIAAKHWAKDMSPGEFRDNYLASVRAGEVDDKTSSAVQATFAALRRGIELAREQQP